VAGFGSSAHRGLIDQVVAHYRHDERIRAIAVFGSLGAGTWHELSDVDFDIVTEDWAKVAPAGEIAALFGTRAAIVLAHLDSADVVLDSLAELSIRWHPLRDTSPNITATAVVRDAIGARKALVRGRRWEAVAAVERVRGSLTRLRGRRDGLRLDPADPAAALDAVLAETAAEYDLGPTRRALLDRAHRTLIAR
jgi:predicted nucleotidyltransferase